MGTVGTPRFRARVKDLLYQQDRNQTWLAGRLGRDVGTVSRLITGARSKVTTAQYLELFAQALGVSVPRLVEGTEYERGAVPEDPVARAYDQRNQLAMLAVMLARAAGFRAGRYRDPEAAEERFAQVVQIDLPTGQVSYHVDARDPLVASIPAIARTWDGHTPHEAGRRLAAYVQQQGILARGGER